MSNQPKQTSTDPRSLEDSGNSDLGAVVEVPERPEVDVLRAENARLRARIAELEGKSAPPAAIRWDPQGLIISWSAEAEQLLGWSAAEVLGRSALGLLSAVTAETDALLRSFIVAGQLGQSCGMVHDKSGRVQRCKWRNVREFDSQRACSAVSSYLMPLTGESELVEQLLFDQILMQTILDNAPSICFVKAPDGHYLFTNQHLESMYSTSRERILSGKDIDFWPEDVAATMRRKDRDVENGKRRVQFEETIPQPDGTHTISTIKFPVFDMNGECLGVCGIATDVTDRTRAEEERNALQQQAMAAQEAALREMSTPLIPVADGLLIMPLIGTIDQNRARQVLESLLAGIVEQRSRLVILDITGVRSVNAEVAATLVQAASAARLLGVQVLLTGISAAMAQVLVTLQTDLKSMVTLGTLQSGIAYALKQIHK